MNPPKDMRTPTREDQENIRTEIENLSSLVAKFLQANGFLKPAELEHLREMMQEHRNARRYRRNLRIYTGYVAAAVIFFYTLREYVSLFWNWLKAILK